MTQDPTPRLPRRPTSVTARASSQTEDAPPMVVTVLTTIGVAGMSASLLYALVTLGILSVHAGIFA